MSETYEISVQCHNCKYVPQGEVIERERNDGQCFRGSDPRKFSILKGMEVKQFLREIVCDNCGCDGFMGIL